MFATAAKWSCAVALIGALASTARADEADNLFNTASAQYSARQWEQASQSFGKHLHDYPGHQHHAKALFFQGESLVQLGRYAEAYPLFRDLLAEEPAGAFTKQATFRTAEAAAMSGKYNEAQVFLSQFQSKYPADKLNARVLLYQGSIALKANDLPGAERCYRESLEHFADSPSADECRMALVHVLQTSKRAEAANEVLLEIAHGNHSPWTETALLQLANKEFAAQKPQAALEHCEDLGKRFPASPMLPQAMLGYGRALFELNRLDEAHAVLAELAATKDFAADARPWLAKVEKSQQHLKLVAEAEARKLKEQHEAEELKLKAQAQAEAKLKADAQAKLQAAAEAKFKPRPKPSSKPRRRKLRNNRRKQRPPRSLQNKKPNRVRLKSLPLQSRLPPNCATRLPKSRSRNSTNRRKLPPSAMRKIAAARPPFAFKLRTP